MYLEHLNLDEKTAKALELRINDLRDNYLDDLYDIRRQAELAAEEVIEEYGADLTRLRESYEQSALKANELAQRYYASVRDVWDSLADMDLPSYGDVNIGADKAAYKQFGGLNNTDHPGYTFDQIATRSNKAGIGIDDMWSLGVRHLDTDDLVSLAGQLVRQTARLTIEETSDADTSKPRYARVPSGPKTCAFCVMLASRGFAYSSERSAGGEDDKYHNDCDCMIIPSWGASKLRGYDPDRYMRMYREALARAGDTDPQTITRWMRHNYPKELTDGASPQKNRSSWTIEKSFTGMRNEKSISRRAWDRRQRALGIPTDWDVLEMHEIVFMEKFKASGQHYDWIPKDEDTFKSTNDFLWTEQGIEVELKSFQNQPKYGKIAANIRKSVKNANKLDVTKDSFIVDLGGTTVSDKLRRQLADYNINNPEARIKRLFVMDDSSPDIWEITLNK